MSGVGEDVEPLGLRDLAVPVLLRPALYAAFRQIGVEVVVGERLVRPLVDGVSFPFEDIFDIRRPDLFLDALVCVLLRVADLRPAVVAGDFWGRVGIDEGDDLLRCLDARHRHVNSSPSHETR